MQNILQVKANSYNNCLLKIKKYLKMRKLKYQLANGIMVNTRKEAINSGQKYKIYLVPITQNILLSPMRKAMLEQFGYVSKNLKDKVVL